MQISFSYLLFGAGLSETEHEVDDGWLKAPPSGGREIKIWLFGDRQRERERERERRKKERMKKELKGERSKLREIIGKRSVW